MIGLHRLRRPSGGSRLLFGAVLALAIALRLLIPQGWMPASGGGLMICPGQTAMMHGGDHAPAKQPDSPCAFAALGVAAAPPPLVATIAPAPRPPAIPAVQRNLVAIGHGLAAPPPPATGPPAFA